MREKYTEAEMTVLRIDMEDIITTSILEEIQPEENRLEEDETDIM